MFDVHKCTAFMSYSNPLHTSVTLPRMEGMVHFFLRNYTKIGLAVKTLMDTAVEMIKARQHESGNTVVCSLHYNYCAVLCSSGCVILFNLWFCLLYCTVLHCTVITTVCGILYDFVQ